jgi:dihydroorotate dehydrogenase
MYIVEKISKLDSKYRHLINNLLPFPINSFFYSNARKLFIHLLDRTSIAPICIPDEFNVKLWDITFNCSVFNAAGMFKKGEGYYTCAKMGAGAYISGTTTYTKRKGNKKIGIKHPFIAYPNSKASSNWLGLPNPSHSYVANEIMKIEKINNCPVGVSVSENPDTTDEMQKIIEVVDGIKLYDKAGVDFIEINLSCPNVEHHKHSNCVIDIGMVNKLNYLSDNFLKVRNRNLPLIVKYSNDINEDELFAAIDILIDLGFDGINIGNTSIKYENYLPSIHPKDIHNYKRFTSTFGGGLSGEILKENSLYLSKIAVEHINKKSINREFNVIRTGGISTASDIIASKNAGVKLNQWFAGFFEMFSKNGFNVYKEMMDEIVI